MKRRVLLILMASSLIFVAACKKEVKKEVKPKKSVKVQAMLNKLSDINSKVKVIAGQNKGLTGVYLGPVIGVVRGREHVRVEYKDKEGKEKEIFVPMNVVELV